MNNNVSQKFTSLKWEYKNTHLVMLARRLSGGPDPIYHLLSLNLVTWIRDDWQLPLCGMPDSCNDEVQCSFAVRDSPNKDPSMGLGEVRSN